MKIFAKSRTISLVIGLVLLALILPGVVSAASEPPKAQFTSNARQGTTSPFIVQFTDQSTGTTPMTYHWDFSDGEGKLPENSQKNPVWRFWEDDGSSFTVSLTVTNAYGSDTIVKQNYITFGTYQPPTPVAAFTSGVQKGTAPLTVQFTDQSTGAPQSYAWDFNNDKKIESTVKSPSFTYTTAGNYTVNLTVKNANGQDSEIKTSYIRVSSPATSTPPTAQFTANTTKGVAPLTVQFTDKSVSAGTTSYSWDINNDGVAEYTTKSPGHTYKAAGNYTVKLTVTNASGSDSEIKTNYIAVSSPVVSITPPAAQLTANTTKGVAPLTVQFTDKSVSAGTTSYSWDINNDGVAEYTTKNPGHTYKAAGNYTVKLTVTNASGSDSEIKTNYIAVSSPVVSTTQPTAQFTAKVQTGTLSVQFTDQSVSAGTTSYKWDFNNDGTTDSTVKSPSFSYKTAGTYTVKLTVTNASGSDSETKTQVIPALSSSSSAPGECYGADACNPTGNPIGGGAGYTDIILQTDARVKYVVTTAAGLKSALASARSGEVVFVPSSATIDLTGSSSITIPAGVILASDRGYSGRPGGLIKRDTSGTMPIATFTIGGNDVRVTGLRIQGPHSGYGASYGDNVKCAIMETNKNGLEVDNNEIYYWSYAGVAFENSASGSWTGHVHHNNIHHIAGEGYGYGVMVAYGDVLIEANKFDYTRHAVIGEGCPGEKFEYRYNHYGKNSLNPVLDCHRDCGGWSAGGVSGRLYLVHHNTIEYAGSVAYNLYGTPSEKVSIYNNIFPTRIQALNGWTRIYLTNNYFGGVLKASGQ